MKRTITFFAVSVIAFLFYACDSSTTAPPDDSVTPLTFTAKSGFVARFDQYEVGNDTDGVYYDKPILATRVIVDETTIDTDFTFQGKTHVSRHVSRIGSGTPDTAYFWQAANGDLYRYNYGFSMLNKVPELVLGIGQPIDMGWVLVMKFGKKEGAEWVAKDSSLIVQFIGKPVFFKSVAKMLADTTIIVGSDSISCRVAQHTITATATISTPDDVKGTIVAKTYISAKYGKVILDFIKSGRITGLYDAHVRGNYKIMTFHE